MIKTFFFLLWICLLGQIFVPFVFGQTTNNSSPDDCKEQRIKKLMMMLDPTNPLRASLESGERGNSERQIWMDKMAGLSIRQAGFTLSYLIGSGPLNVKVVSSHYYYNYFDYDAAISEKTRKRLMESGLDRELEEAAVQIASRRPETILAGFRRQYPSIVGNKKIFCGKIYVELLDDEALPTPEKLPTIETQCQ